MNVKRLLMMVLGSFVLGSLLFTAPALADNVVVVGGWSEDSGYFTTLPASRAGQPQHTGQTEQRSINGTTNNTCSRLDDPGWPIPLHTRVHGT